MCVCVCVCVCVNLCDYSTGHNFYPIANKFGTYVGINRTKKYTDQVRRWVP